MFGRSFWSFNDFPTLETERLLLRRLLVRDKDDMYEYAHKSEITKYLLWHEHPTRDYTARYLKYLQGCYRRGEYYDWAVVLKEQDKMIGTCGFVEFDNDNNSAEIGYVISDKFHSRGFATEAVKCAIAFGFESLKLNRIVARHIVGNDASGRVMTKCGMSFEGIQRKAMYIKEYYRDIAQYAILKEDFERSENENQ